MPMLRQLSKDERDVLVKDLHAQQSSNCFICGKSIDLVLHKNNLDIDHIIPTKLGGKDEVSNYALTHDSCNRSKQASDLRVARVLAKFDQLHERLSGENRAPNLGDLLKENAGAKYDLPIATNATEVNLSFPELGRNEVFTIPLYSDDLSGFAYFFTNLPIEYLHHDEHINPRAIGTNLKKLVEEFHKKIPQLHVALAWMDTDGDGQAKIHVFDGQHKAAAQILLGARTLPVRVFVNPDKDVLLTANTHAGTTLRQVAFDKSVQRSLGSSLLADRMTRFRDDKHLDEDYELFSEQDLVNHFKGESREMKRYILDWVRSSVTTHMDNKLRDYIDYAGRGTEMPMSYSSVEKTFYSLFIHQGMLATPFNFKMDVGENPRRLEIDQLVQLMNIVAETLFIGRYDHAIGTRRIENKIQKGEDVPELHLTAFRMAKEEIMFNWLKCVRQIIQMYFVGTGRPFDESKLFQYQIPDAVWGNIRRFLENLRNMSVWVNKDLSLSVFGGKRNNDFWASIFTSGSSPDGTEVLPSGINLQNMIQKRENEDN